MTRPPCSQQALRLAAIEEQHKNRDRTAGRYYAIRSALGRPECSKKGVVKCARATRVRAFVRSFVRSSFIASFDPSFLLPSSLSVHSFPLLLLCVSVRSVILPRRCRRPNCHVDVCGCLSDAIIKYWWSLLLEVGQRACFVVRTCYRSEHTTGNATDVKSYAASCCSSRR